MRKLAVACSVIAILSSCAGAAPSQTREEFIQNKLSGAPFSMVDSYVTNRRFDDVVNTLKQKTAECFNVNVTTHRTESPGGITTMKTTDEYRTTIRVVNANRAELTTQRTSKGQISLQKVPEGGFYHRAIDIERLTSSTTKLTYYGPSLDSSKRAWAAIKQWSGGQQSPCP